MRFYVSFCCIITAADMAISSSNDYLAGKEISGAFGLAIALFSIFCAGHVIFKGVP